MLGLGGRRDGSNTFPKRISAKVNASYTKMKRKFTIEFFVIEFADALCSVISGLSHYSGLVPDMRKLI